MKENPDMENVVPLGGRREVDQPQLARAQEYLGLHFVEEVGTVIYQIDTLVGCVRDHLHGRGRDGRKRAQALLDVITEKAKQASERHGRNAELSKELIAKHFEGKL